MKATKPNHHDDALGLVAVYCPRRGQRVQIEVCGSIQAQGTRPCETKCCPFMDSDTINHAYRAYQESKDHARRMVRS